MYIRRKTVKCREYYQLVEGYRDDAGKVRHRTLASLGTSATIPDAIKAAELVVRRATRVLKRLETLYPEGTYRRPRVLERLEALRLQLTQHIGRRERLKELLARPVVSNSLKVSSGTLLVELTQLPTAPSKSCGPLS
jgi:hypothetical protein